MIPTQTPSVIRGELQISNLAFEQPYEHDVPPDGTA
jgi:hypothetical protein